MLLEESNDVVDGELDGPDGERLDVLHVASDAVVACSPREDVDEGVFDEDLERVAVATGEEDADGLVLVGEVVGEIAERRFRRGGGRSAHGHSLSSSVYWNCRSACSQM